MGTGQHCWIAGVLGLWLVVGMLRTAPKAQNLRIVFFTMEYRHETFSGNGVYSTRQVKSLRSLGYSVLVVCAAPDGLQNDQAPDERIVTVPQHLWGSLRDDGPWEAFASGATEQGIVSAIHQFNPDAILAVDWHGYEAATRYRLKESPGAQRPILLLNYRVFSKDEVVDGVLRQMEARSAQGAAGAVALNFADEQALRELGAATTTTVLPAVREDVKAFALEAMSSASPRRLLVCCVRLAPEKNAFLFAQVVARLAPFLERERIEPVLCAPPKTSDPDYRARVIREFNSANVTNSRVVERFLGASDMATLHQRAILNFHPPTYDAYGMSIVEAAAFGTATMLHAPDSSSNVHVGAAEFLRPSRSEALGANLGAGIESVATSLKSALQDPSRLREVGVAAQKRALAWDESANAVAVVTFLIRVISGVG
eukprot:m.450983 g.450983  ORF g.450983 m.450983 type:complete len:427 (+) comp20080_c0_seq1:327-1607(+)